MYPDMHTARFLRDIDLIPTVAPSASGWPRGPRWWGRLLALAGTVLGAPTPAQARPVSDARAAPVPADVRLTDTSPIDTALVDTALVDTALVDTALVDTALVDTALVDTTVRRGRQDFSIYDTPMGCLTAAGSVEGLAHRSATDSSSARYRPEETLPSSVVAVARRCGTHFTVATVAPAALLELAKLALLRGDDATAYAAAERYVAAQGDPERRRWALYQVDTLYLTAKPMRLTAAEAVAARLDSLGPAAALQRKLAHERLLVDARQRYDVDRLRREVLAVLRACHQESARDSLDLEASCTEASMVLDLFFEELYRNPKTALAQTRQLVSSTGFTDWQTFDAMMHGTHLDWVVAQSGKPVPPLQAQHWAGPKGRVPGWPVPGKVSIFLRGSLATDNPKKLARWKRLGEEFKDALDITILVPSQGYFQVGIANNGPPLTPAEEAARVGKFYREQLGLPVTVALVETPVTQLPPPDGRRILGEPPLQKDPFYGSEFLLADREGKLLLGQVIGEEPLLHAWVARAVGR